MEAVKLNFDRVSGLTPFLPLQTQCGWDGVHHTCKEEHRKLSLKTSHLQRKLSPQEYLREAYLALSYSSALLMTCQKYSRIVKLCLTPTTHKY